MHRQHRQPRHGRRVRTRHPEAARVGRHTRFGKTKRGSVPPQAAANVPGRDADRRVDDANHPPAKRPTLGRSNSSVQSNRHPSQAQPGRVQGVRVSSRLASLAYRHIDLHGLPGLHVLLRAGSMAQCQATAPPAKLPATGRSLDQIAPQRMPRYYIAEGARGAQVKEAAALERQERGAFRGH